MAGTVIASAIAASAFRLLIQKKVEKTLKKLSLSWMIFERLLEWLLSWRASKIPYVSNREA